MSDRVLNQKKNSAGHHKPVDVWAMGVITYFLLCGYTPFDRDSQAKETEAIIAGDYKFEPVEYWQAVSETAKEFIRCCLTVDPHKRPTAQLMLEHKWLSSVPDANAGTAPDLLPGVKRNFDARKTCGSFYFHLTIGCASSTPLNIVRKAVFSMMAMNRMSSLRSPAAEAFGEDLRRYKEESEKVRLLVVRSPSYLIPTDYLCPQEVVDENERVFHHHGSDDGGQEVLSTEISKLSVDDK